MRNKPLSNSDIKALNTLNLMRTIEESVTSTELKEALNYSDMSHILERLQDLGLVHYNKKIKEWRLNK